MNQYKNLTLWKKSIELVTKIYQLTEAFPLSERFNLISQINRAAVSIPSNIAEGAGRNSDKEFKYFLSIAHASSYELETQLIIADNLDYLPHSMLTELLDDIVELQKMNYSLQRTLKS